MPWCWSKSQHLLSIHIGKFQSTTKSVSDQASVNTYTIVFDRNSYQTYHRRCHCGGQVSPLCSKMVTKVIILRLEMTGVNHWLIVSSSNHQQENLLDWSCDLGVPRILFSPLLSPMARVASRGELENNSDLNFNSSRHFTWVHIEARMPDTWFSSLVSSPVMHQCHLMSPS